MANLKEPSYKLLGVSEASEIQKTDFSQDRQLAATLAKYLDGLVYITEAENPYQVILWPSCIKALTTKELFAANGFIKPETLQLKSNLDLSLPHDLQYAGLKNSSCVLPPLAQGAFDSIKLAIETVAGNILRSGFSNPELYMLSAAGYACVLQAYDETNAEWIGFTLRFDSQYTGIPLSWVGFDHACAEVKLPDSTELQRITGKLLEKLGPVKLPAGINLKPVEEFALTSAKSAERCFEQALLLTNLCTWENKLCFEFRKGGEGQWNRALKLMQENLSNFRTWYVKNPSYEYADGTHNIYCFGQTNTGNHIGIWTTAAWT